MYCNTSIHLGTTPLQMYVTCTCIIVLCSFYIICVIFYKLYSFIINNILNESSHRFPPYKLKAGNFEKVI